MFPRDLIMGSLCIQEITITQAAIHQEVRLDRQVKEHLEVRVSKEAAKQVVEAQIVIRRLAIHQKIISRIQTGQIAVRTMAANQVKMIMIIRAMLREIMIQKTARIIPVMEAIQVI